VVVPATLRTASVAPTAKARLNLDMDNLRSIN
jgi:hypothetical protein